MSVIWHLIKKDLRRLRWPLALFSLILGGEILFYAAIAGLTHAPDLGWLNRLFSGPEVLLRTLAEPVLTFLIVGWLVFEDSPVEKDAHWITRPISGGQILAAKLGAAVLVLILWPLVLNICWWLACGSGVPEIMVSAREFVGFYWVLVSLALACAALTDGFPRFILWNFVGFIVFAIVQLVFNLNSAAVSGLIVSRLLIGGIVSSVAALAIAVHQFVTRRHRRSLALTCAGVVLAGLASGWWRWDFIDGESPSGSQNPELAGLTVQPAGPVSLQQMKTRYYVRLPLKLDGLPDDVLMGRISGTSEWSFAGQRVWTSSIGFSDGELRHQAIQRVLGLKGPLASAGRFVLPLLFSRPLAQRAARDPIALHADVQLHLLHVSLLTELPVRETAAPVGARNCTISQVYYGPRRKNTANGLVVPPDAPRVVSLYVTERAAGGFRENASFRTDALQYALVNRRTGEFFLRDPVQSGPVGYTLLNQVRVSSALLTFNTGIVKLNDLTLAVLRFGRLELIRRDLEINPVTFAQAAP